VAGLSLRLRPSLSEAHPSQCVRCGAELRYPTDDELIPSAKEVKAMRAAAGR